MSIYRHPRDIPVIRCLAVFWALLALLVPACRGHADQQTTAYNLTFSTQGQQIWGTDAFQNFSSDQYYRQSWDDSGSAGGYDDPCVDLGWPAGNSCLGDFGASASGSTKGEIGVGFHARGSNGAATVTYPLTLHFTFPTDGAVFPGDTFQVSAAYAPGAGAQIASTSPSFRAWVDTPFRFSAAAHAEAEAFGDSIFNNDLFNFGFDVDPTLLDTDWLTSSSPYSRVVRFILNQFLQNYTRNVFSYSLTPLNLNLTGGPAATGLQLQAQGGQNLLTLNADLTNLIIAILIELQKPENNLPAGEQAKAGTLDKIGSFLSDQILFNKVVSAGGFTLNKQLADLRAATALSLQQTLSFTPTPTVALLLSTGQVVFLRGTDPVTLTMPTPPPGASQNPLTITPVVISLDDNVFTNHTSLVVTPGLTFTPLNLSFGGSVAGHSLGNHSFKPTSTITLFTDPTTAKDDQRSFTLGGFNAAGPQAPFTVVGYTYPAPTITPNGLSLNTATASNAGTTLTVTGTNFVDAHGSNSGTTVLINNVLHTTTYVSATQVQTTLSAADVAGNSTVTVWNPAPGGGTSNAATITAPGPVAAWGANNRGQLGNNSTTDSSLPVAVATLTRPGQKITAGSQHSLALLDDQTVWAWGENGHGELGNNSTAISRVPVQVTGTLDGDTNTAYLARKTIDIAAGGVPGGAGHSVVRTNANGTQMIGNDGSSFDAPYIYNGHYAAYSDGGDGLGHYGYFNMPDLSEVITDPNYFPTTWAWGANALGQIGDATTNARSTATPVMLNDTPLSLTLVNAQDRGNGSIPSVNAMNLEWSLHPPAHPSSGYHITSEVGNMAYACCTTLETGNEPSAGFLNWLADNLRSFPTYTQTFPNYLTGETQTASGDEFTLFVNGSGFVKATGRNSDGQFGNGGTTSSSLPTTAFSFAGFPLRASRIAAGGHHSLFVLTATGVVWAAGDNSHGQLGNNSTTDSPAPVTTLYLPGGRTLDLAAGEGFSLALVNDGTGHSTGTVYAWGDNTHGQLGQGDTADRHVPTQIVDTNLTHVVAIKAGSDHALALKDDGTVWAWGKNDHGQLGDGTTIERHIPVQVQGTMGISAIAAGGNHSLAIGRIDATTPITSATISPTPGAADPQSRRWNNTDATVTLRGTASGGIGVTHIVYSATGAQTITSTTANSDTVAVPITAQGDTTITYHSIGFNGRVEAPDKAVTVHLDKTAPTLSFGSPAGSPGPANGWYLGPVSVSVTAGDDRSGVLSTVAGAPFTVAGGNTIAFGAAQSGSSATVTVTDYAGNKTTLSTPVIQIDSAAPATTATPANAANAAGWNSGDVTVRLRSTDDRSGVDHITYGAAGAQPLADQNSMAGSSADAAEVLVSTEGTTTLTYHAADRAGNSEAAHTLTVKVDKTAPALTTQVSPALNANGWSAAALTVTAAASDPPGGSGLSSLAYSATGAQTVPSTPASGGATSVDITQPGITLVTFLATDVAGNRTSRTVPVRVDTGTPTLAAAARTADGNDYTAGTWTNQDVTVAFQSGAASGIASVTGTATTAAGTGSATFHLDPSGTYGNGRVLTTLTADGDAQSVTATATSNAGTSSAPVMFGAIKIDKTAPMTSATPGGTAGSNGWYPGPVQVTLGASDALSGVSHTYYSLDGGAAQVYSAPVPVSGNASHTVAYWSTDNAGNEEAHRSLSVKIDGTGPAIRFGALPTPNAAGWYHASVSVPFSVTDSLSGIDPGQISPGPVTLSADGTQATGTLVLAAEGSAVTGAVSATDNAGNPASQTSPAVKIDLRPPVTIATPSGPGGPAWYGGPVTLALNASDPLLADNTAGSGPAKTCYTVDAVSQQTYTGAFTVSGNGRHTITYWSRDVADNIETANTLSLQITSTTPTVTPSPPGVSAQYSDPIPVIALSATDPAQPLSASIISGPAGLQLTPTSSSAWSLSGIPAVGVGTYSAQVTVTDAATLPTTTTLTIAVTAEDAAVTLPSSNPQAAAVPTAGGASGPITLNASLGDAADGHAGDISTALPVMLTLTPVIGSTLTYTIPSIGSGSLPSGGSYKASVSGGVLSVSATVTGVPVNVYDVALAAGGNYRGSAQSVLSVYDPSLGGASGGGTVLHNGVRSNFGFTAKYLKSGQLQGSLLYIEHQSTGDVVLKSNAMGTLAIVKNASGTGYTAVLTGKATLNGVGNYTFTATGIDNGEPGKNDQYGLQVKDPSGAVVTSLSYSPLTLAGGNIQVPKG